MDLSPDLIAGALARDPRLSKAKKLMIEALAEYQQKITTVRPPQNSLQKSYNEILSTFANIRGNPLYYPYLGSGIGNGALVELLDGSIKYDFISGIGVHYLGHSHKEIVEASMEASLSDTVMQGNLQQNWDAFELSQMLVKASGLDHCFLSTSGAMANENALKLAFQKNSPAQRILAFDHCFAGRSLVTSFISDKASFREGLPPTAYVDYLPFFDPDRPKESTEEATRLLHQYLKRYPKQYAAALIELVQGEGGFYPGSHDFFKAIMTILKEHRVTIIADEVQTFGRTSQLFAFHHFGLQSLVDIVTIGKLSQVCATLFSKNYAPRPGLISQTFTSSTAALRAGKAMIHHLLEGHYFGPQGKIIHVHNLFIHHLQRLADKYPDLIKGPFGIGSMIAFTPYGGDYQKVTQFAQRLFTNGVISFIAGMHPTRIRFLVPVGAISEKDIQEAMTIVEQTLLQK